MAQIKKDTSLRKAILQAAITGQLISDIGGESDVLFSNEKKSKTKLDSEADLPLASRVSKRNSVVSDSERTTPSPRGYAPKTPNEFASFENQNSVSERSERPTLPETGKQLLDRIIEERNKKLLAEWEEVLKKNVGGKATLPSFASKTRAKKPAPVVASEIDEEELPFEIPENWCWCKVKDISEVFGRIGFRGYTTNDLVLKGNGAITISPSNLLENGITDFSKCTYISWNKYEESPEIKIFDEDILMVKTGSSYGKTGIVKNLPEKATINPQLAVLKNILINRYYLNFVFQTPFARTQYENFVLGTSIPTFSQEKLNNFLLPLPPLSVQNAIVAKLEQALPLVDAYENALLQKEELKSALPDKIKKAILQEAITGQLTENWRKSATIKESGKQLLNRIIEERNAKALADWEEALKKNVGGKATLPSFASKTRAKKPVSVVASEIDEEEIPFEVPESWCWCHLGEICNEIKRGKSPKYVDRSDYLAFAQKCNVKTGGIDLSLALYLDEKSIDRYSEEDNLIKGDVVINSTGGGTMGRVGYYETKVPEGIKGVYPDSHVTVIRSVGNINQRYLYYILKHNQPVLEDCGTGSTNQTELKPAVLANFVIPLPPLEEQEAIVRKVEELLPLCK